MTGVQTCALPIFCKLREKLSLACGGDNYIETVWGRGYVLRDAGEVELGVEQAAVA